MTLKYDHLLGHQFLLGTRDCYSLLKDFYADNFGIELPNYARPADFWKHGINLYWENYSKNGFYPLDCHPSEYQPGDVVLMAMRSTIANHAAVLVENGQIIHHLQGRMSEKTGYIGVFRNTTVGVFRHKDVVVETVQQTANIEDYLSPRVLEKIRERRASQEI